MIHLLVELILVMMLSTVVGIVGYICARNQVFFRRLLIVLKRFFRNSPISASMIYCVGPVVVIYALPEIAGIRVNEGWLMIPFLCIVVFTASTYLYLGNVLQGKIRWSRGAKKFGYVVFAGIYAIGLIPYMSVMAFIVLRSFGLL